MKKERHAPRREGGECRDEVVVIQYAREVDELRLKSHEGDGQALPVAPAWRSGAGGKEDADQCDRAAEGGEEAHRV